MAKRKDSKRLTVDLSDSELTLLEQYCEQEGVNKTQAIRSFIKSLKRKLKPKEVE